MGTAVTWRGGLTPVWPPNPHHRGARRSQRLPKVPQNCNIPFFSDSQRDFDTVTTKDKCWILVFNCDEVLWSHIFSFWYFYKLLTNHLKEIISYRQLHVMDETHVINLLVLCRYAVAVTSTWALPTSLGRCEEGLFFLLFYAERGHPTFAPSYWSGPKWRIGAAAETAAAATAAAT